MNLLEKIGFAFTNKKVLYVHDQLEIDTDILYKSIALGNNADIFINKEDDENGKYL